ncbi:hypothetical protein KTS45_05315 [Halomicroarcula limicola]|uniref:Nudix hydrolase domain-containing protein n=1 Tax=Haloarcula limicola TaxID=1429915 RepID=A0A8J7Y3C7_9EURY|nr:NUDIX domain-containing protein [Halomicroarcula limicola]MBV0923615.1 hypothetical protein [Halomicroarcula limicola]
MDVSDRSRSRIKEWLERIESEVGSPTVTQTTFEVAEDGYRRALDQAEAGNLDIQAVVRDDDDAVLLSEDDGGWGVPRGRPRDDEGLTEATERIVRDATGVDCAVTDATSATISGIRNADDETAATVYRLSVVFTAELTEAEAATDEAVRWDTDPDPVAEIV